jgi:adenylate kinase
LDAVVVMTVDDEALIARIAGRFTCVNCGEGYNDTYKTPETEGVCDKCGSREFVRRDDDSEDSIRIRLSAYHELTEPLLPYYRQKGNLFAVNALRKIDQVEKEIVAALETA